MTVNIMKRSGKTAVVAVGASSKKAGKSSLASYLVRRLGADFSLKVSCCGSHPTSEPIVSNPSIISRPGTDTAALFEAGAREVLWVNCSKSELAGCLQRALGMFPAGGLLVAEGNSAVSFMEPDFTVFLVAVSPEEFKPSARRALARADLVIIDLSKDPTGPPAEEVESALKELAPAANFFSFTDQPGREEAWEKAAVAAEEALALKEAGPARGPAS